MNDISQRLREHDDPRLYREADILMSEGATEIDCLRATIKTIAELADKLFASPLQYERIALANKIGAIAESVGQKADAQSTGSKS